MLTGNWIEKNGVRIAIPAEIALQTNSPLDDKTYVFYSGNKQSTRGDNTYPFTIKLSQKDLAALGMPHIIQKITIGYRQTGWTLYSDGTLLDTFTMLFTGIERDLNGTGVSCEVMLFNPVSDFVNAINNKNVNDLLMDGVRVIKDVDGSGNPYNYYTGNLYNAGTTPPATQPGKPFQGKKVNYTLVPPGSVSGSSALTAYTITCVAATSASPADLCGTATADYAAIITLNGDPNADENGDYICFHPILVQDPSGDSWINFWDPTGDTYFPCVGICPDNNTGVDIYAQNLYQDYGNHIVPMYYYHQVLRHCFSEFGYTLKDESGILDDPHFKRMIIENNFDILNALAINFTNQAGDRNRCVGYWQAQTVINPVNHLPQDSIQDFLNDCMVKFNCYFEFRGQTVYIRFSDFKTVARELENFNPKYKESNTLDTGVTIAYDFPSDKQYDCVKQMLAITPYLETEKVFQANLNNVYVIPIGDTVPNPLPTDDYYAMLYEDCNQIGFNINNWPAYAGMLVYPYNFIADNVLPITLGIETRPDSPSVNLKTVSDSNAQSYNLKYPPISQINNNSASIAKQSPYNLTGWGIETTSTARVVPAGDPHFSDPSYQDWTVGNTINMFVTKGLVITPGMNVLITPNLGTYGRYEGYFWAQATVTSYNSDTYTTGDSSCGQLTLLVTAVMPQLPAAGTYSPTDVAAWRMQGIWIDNATYGATGLELDGYLHDNSGSGPWGWDSWNISIQPYVITPQIVYAAPGGAGSILINPPYQALSMGLPYISVPIMQSPISSFPTQTVNITPSLAFAYTYNLFQHGWGFNILTAQIGGYVYDIISGVPMPEGWEKRSAATIFEMAFYWGIQQMYTNMQIYYSSSYVTNQTILSAPRVNMPAGIITSSGSTPVALYIPVATGYERIYGNTGVTPGWFNLGLFGPLSLPRVFWDGFINQFIYNRKFEITVYEPIRTTRNHAFYQSVLWRGIRLYVSQQSVALPQTGKGVKYLAYQI